MRADRFCFDKDRKKFIVRVGILRTILGRYVGVEPNALRFIYGKRGKPMLADLFLNGSIHFSMSHSEGLALYAFTCDHEMGVDTEFIRDIPEMDQIAERFFSARENAVFRSLPASKKREAFFNYWTRKEAFIKAVGEGLYLPLDAFDVSLVPGKPARLLRTDENLGIASRWFIQELKPAPGFAGALALERPVPVCYYQGLEQDKCVQQKSPLAIPPRASTIKPKGVHPEW